MRNYKTAKVLPTVPNCFPIFSTSIKTLFLAIALAAMSCSSKKNEIPSTLADSSLSSIFEHLTTKTNPFEFYKTVFENFRFELKSTVLISNPPEDSPPLESITIYESNDQENSRFYKKSLEPISEVEWLEKQNKDFIRYDDSKHFHRTSYNPEFEKWKKEIFQDIQSTFDLSALEKTDPKTEKNQWSCYQIEKQKLCLDAKTGLPVFGKALKQIKPDTAVSMVFSLVYGEDSVSNDSESDPPPASEEKEKAPPAKAPKKESLQRKH